VYDAVPPEYAYRESLHLKFPTLNSAFDLELKILLNRNLATRIYVFFRSPDEDADMSLLEETKVFLT